MFASNYLMGPLGYIIEFFTELQSTKWNLQQEKSIQPILLIIFFNCCVFIKGSWIYIKHLRLSALYCILCTYAIYR